MKKIIFFIFLFLVPFKISAYYCDYAYYNELQKKASNVNILKEYEVFGDTAVFKITIYNLSEGQYVVDEINGKTYYYEGQDSIELAVVNPGMYKFLVYSSDNYCDENSLNTLFAEIPTYNKFYKDELCIGIENYKYCQRWFSGTISYDDFKKAVNEYRESLKKPETGVSDEYKSIFTYLLEFYVAYWFVILPVIIVGGIILIFVKRKQENQFNL